MMEGASERSRLRSRGDSVCASQACVAALVAKVEASQRLERREAYYSAKLLQTERKAQKAQQSVVARPLRAVPRGRVGARSSASAARRSSPWRRRSSILWTRSSTRRRMFKSRRGPRRRRCG